MNNKASTINYLKYWLKSVNEHGIHSPFVFDLVTNVIYTDKDYYSYKKVETLREKLLNSEKLVAGKKVSKLAEEALESKYGKLLFRLVNWFQPETIVEIGASFGIETCYMAISNSLGNVIKLGADYENFVLENSNDLKLKNVRVMDKSIKSNEKVLNTLQYLDFAFLDVLDAKELLLYFNQCVSKSTVNSVFVINNINTTKEMKAAWELLKDNEKVRVSIDLFQIGILFFRTEQVKEHFVVRF